jgi:hypothetical protein
MPRKCIFCGDRADSVEDAFPLWLSERYKAAGIMDHQPGIEQPALSYPVSQPKIRIKKVCKKCNNEWMNRIQQSTRPVIERLLDEPECELDVHVCRTLALWSCMTAMVMESVNAPDHWAFTDNDRRLLYSKSLTPESADVWIVKCVNFTTCTGVARIQANPGSPDRVGTTTLCFTPLVIQIRKMHIPTAKPGVKITIYERPWEWDQVLLRIWPLAGRPVHWPGEKGLDGYRGFVLLGHRFTGLEDG